MTETHLPVRRGTLRRTILSAFGVALALTVALGATGVWSARRMASTTNSIYRHDVVGLVELGATLQDLTLVRQAALLHILATDPREMSKLREDIEALDAKMDGHFTALDGVWTLDSKLEALRSLEEAWNDYTELRDRALVATASGDRVLATELAFGAAGDRFEKVSDAVSDLVRINDDSASSRHEQTRSTASTATFMVLIASILAVAGSVTMALVLANRASRAAKAVATAAVALAEGDLGARADVTIDNELGTLAEAFNAMADRVEALVAAERQSRDALERAVADYSEFASHIAHGDLRARVHTNGTAELTQLTANLNEMADGLASLSSGVGSGVQRITSATAEILAAVSQHTASAREQAAAVSETSVTADEVRAASEQSAARAEDVASQAEASASISAEGAAAIEAVEQAMHDIRARVDEIAHDIIALSDRTQQVGDIVTAVSELADQSNLLAVNAAVEAAKAGEQGRGFAVVADEVRSLAEQSKHATVRIREILGEIQKATNAAVLATEQGSRVVDAGENQVRQAGTVIEKLGETIQDAVQTAQQIAASAHQQSLGMDQIATAMREVGAATDQFVGGAQQSEQAAKNLNELAQELRDQAAAYQV